jgi:hypothetical protein
MVGTTSSDSPGHASAHHNEAGEAEFGTSTALSRIGRSGRRAHQHHLALEGGDGRSRPWPVDPIDWARSNPMRQTLLNAAQGHRSIVVGPPPPAVMLGGVPFWKNVTVHRSRRVEEAVVEVTPVYGRSARRRDLDEGPCAGRRDSSDA